MSLKVRLDNTDNVWVTESCVDVPDTDTFMARMRDPLARFIHVVTPLAQIYNLPMTSLHVFYDMAGGLYRVQQERKHFH